ncbi:MAG: PD-(D/E)XK nuclease family protein, partial [Blastocatellia bacterium]
MIQIVTSTSSRARLTAARSFIDRFPASFELLLVAASRGAADDLSRDICRTRGASFGLHRFSITQLAARAAATELAALGRTPATQLAAEALAARVAFEGVRDRAFEYFEPVAQLPGFPRAVARTVDELRQAGVATGSLSHSGPGGQDLALLVERFVELADEAAASDRAALFAAASGACHRATFPWRGRPVLLLDVPVESTAERTFIASLLTVSGEALVTIPEGDDDSLEAYASLGHKATTLDDDAPPHGDVGRLRHHLFAAEPPAEREPAGDVELFSAPGEGRESVEIARRMIAAAQRGVRFDEMAVFLRSPHEYVGLLEHAFQRAGIPAYFDRGTRRPDPSGRAFIAILSCAVERLSAKRFDEYLSLGQVPARPEVERASLSLPDDDLLSAVLAVTEQLSVPADVFEGPDGPESDEDAIIGGTLRAPWKWEELVVESAVIGGPERWRRRLKGLEYEYETRKAALEKEEPESPRVRRYARDLRNLQHLRNFALPIVDTLEGWWSDRVSWCEWLSRLTALAPRVLKFPDRVLRVLADLRPMSEIGPVSLDEAGDVLAERLLLLEREPPINRYGRVFVGSPQQARGRQFRIVFVPGLAERMFPQRLREDPLLLDDSRAAIGAALATQDDRAGTERLLLRLALGAATEQVHVSYPRIHLADTRARVPSFYLLDVARAVRGQLPDHQQLETEAAVAGGANLAWPAPANPAEAIDDLEHDLAVLRQLLDRPDRQSARGRARYMLLLNESLRRSMSATWERSQKTWKPSDGVVRITDRTRAALAAERLSARPYSLSALQRFASCPYQFVLSAIFRLEPWEEPEPLQRMDPLTRGSIFHRMQAEFFRALKASEALPVTHATLPTALATLEAVVIREAERWREDLAPAIDRVWNDEIDDIRRDLRVWIERQADEDAWRPEYFEFSFGLCDEGRDDRSVPDPVVIGDGFLLRGSVDLIERHHDGAFRVTDHKTGKNRTIPTLVIDGGRVLQPVLYSMAIERALGGQVMVGRLSYCTTAGGFTEHPIKIDRAARAAGIEALSTIDRAIETGFLPAAPAPDACRWCDFLT